jgi:hypothetical protein
MATGRKLSISISIDPAQPQTDTENPVVSLGIIVPQAMIIGQSMNPGVFSFQEEE